MKTIVYLAIGVIVIIALGALYQSNALPGQSPADTDTNQEETVSENENNDSMPVEEDEGISDGAEPLEEAPSVGAQVELAQSLEFTGLSEAEAQTLAEENDLMFRVVERDGEPQAMTMDYRPGRINATVEEGAVVEYTIEGSADMQ